MNRKPILIAVWSAHRLLLIGLGSLLGLNIFLFSLLFFGVAPKLSQTDRDLALLQQQLRRSDVVTPQQAYEEGVKDYTQFRTQLPSLRNFSALIDDLYTLAEKCHLEISQISYSQKEIPETGLMAYALKFSLSGTYDELKRFVYGLEESKRLVVIDQMNLNAAKGKDGADLVMLSLSLTTYFGTEEEE